MKKFAFLAVALMILTAAGSQLIAADPEKLTGSYVWNNRPDNPGDLEAVFTPTGDGTWDVSFYFQFRGRDHEYTGTATGSLTDGKLEGRVQNENKERTWTFTGTFADGKFDGTHEELTEGRAGDTGTMTLSR